MSAQNQREPDFLDKVLQSPLNIFIIIFLLSAVAVFLGRKYLANVIPGYAYIQRQLQRPPPTPDDVGWDDDNVFGLAASDLTSLRTGSVNDSEDSSLGAGLRNNTPGQPLTSANLRLANTEVLAAALDNGRHRARSASLSHQPRQRHCATNRVVVHVGGVTLGAVEESGLARRRANTLNRGRSQ